MIEWIISAVIAGARYGGPVSMWRGLFAPVWTPASGSSVWQSTTGKQPFSSLTRRDGWVVIHILTCEWFAFRDRLAPCGTTYLRRNASPGVTWPSSLPWASIPGAGIIGSQTG